MQGEIIDGKYEVITRIGEGGMGAVYEGKNLRTGRRVAIKLVNSKELSGPESISRFEREARACGRVESPHIGQVLDAGTCSSTGRPFMVMELLLGEDLHAVFVRLGALVPDVALRIVAQACIGLRTAHEAGIVHRDVKPANLFLTRGVDDEVVVKLLDFGIAKIQLERMLSDEGVRLTRTGAVLGSPLYMSPEQAVGAKDVDARTDVWSLGVVLFEALTGVAPHTDADTLGKLILTICSEPVPPVETLAPWVPKGISAIVAKALEVKRQHRYASITEMLGAIRAQLPQGIALRADEILPIDPEKRALVAERVALVSSGRREHDANAATIERSVLSEPPNPYGETTAAAAASIERARGSGRRWWVAPAAVATALMAVVGYSQLRGSSGVAAPIDEKATDPRPRSVDEGPKPPLAPPAPVVVAPDPTVEQPRGSSTATVRVAIVPPNAKVELDGRPVAAVDGSIEIKGAVGSSHAVKVRDGRRESFADVTIGESGATPDRVEVDRALGGAAAPRASVSRTTTAVRPPAGESKPTPAPAATFDRQFQ